jgi:hypothetical protein
MAATSAESAAILMAGVFDVRWGELATKDDLERFATKDDLERFATKKDFEKLPTKDDLARVERKVDDLRVEMHAAFSAQTWKMVTAMIAFAGLLTAGMHFA